VTGTGLFLGAGASFESGMPLVWDLSAEIRAWLTPNKLRELNLGWRAQGNGNPDETIDTLVASLLNTTMHYENILGQLEVQFVRPSNARQGNLRQSYHSLYSWLVELVYHLLYYRHVQNEAFIIRTLRYLEGIAGLARASNPLWIFSLNHDLIVECVAAHYGARLDCGFSGTGTLPLRDGKGVRIGDLPVQTLAVKQLETSGLDFKNLTEPGINLIKIHGALDVFTANDGHDLIKLATAGDGVAAVLQSLRAAGENLLYYDPAFPGGGRVKALNEIAYADEAGIMQFLRKTLLAGAFKFNQRSTQVLPPAFLKQFKDYLLRVSRLICIGYGCGDLHINQILREWLEFTGDRHVEFVGPGTTSCPSFLGHVASQVILRDEFATDFLERYAITPLTFGERLAKAGLRGARNRQRQRKGFA
jgi:hypothetical protein